MSNNQKQGQFLLKNKRHIQIMNKIVFGSFMKFDKLQ